MNENIRSKLLALPQEKLVDALMSLASESELNAYRVQQLISDDQENRLRFLRRLDSISKQGDFVSWKYASEFSNELLNLLSDISEIKSPAIGFDLICSFYRADEFILKQCDDSGGHIGDVFQDDAFKMFQNFALKHRDRRFIIETAVDLLKTNSYGARDVIGTHAKDYLSKEELLEMYNVVGELLSSDKREYASWTHLRRSLASQMNDAALYESLVYDWMNRNPHSGQIIEIARVYLKSGDLLKAQELLDSIAEDVGHYTSNKTDLQKEIYFFQGNTLQLKKIFLGEFHKYPSETTLKNLEPFTDKFERQHLVDDVCASILKSESFSSTKAEFLGLSGDFDQVEKYIVKNRERIDGDYYSSLLNLAEALATNHRNLGASLIYRALVLSILKRGKSKSYHHGVDYLKKLDRLSSVVQDWQESTNHAGFVSELKSTHKAKRSFWSQYK